MTNNRVYNDAFRTFTLSMQQNVSFTYQLPYDPKKIKIILLILDFKLGMVDNRKDYLQTWGEFFFFIIIFIKTGIQDFLLDIYSAYKSFV